MEYLVPLFCGGMIMGILFWRYVRNKAARRKLPQDGSLCRELGDTIEMALYNQHAIGNQLLANALFLVSKEAISVGDMKTALMRLARRHPMLRMKTVSQGCEAPAYFEELKEFTPDFTVSSNTDWKEVYEEQLHTPYGPDSMPWRVAYLPKVVQSDADDVFKYQYTFVFGFCHQIIDGTSYVKVFDEFLDDLEAAHQGDGDEVQSQPLPPPIEDILPEHLHPTKGAAVVSAILEYLMKFYLVKKLLFFGSLPPNPWINTFVIEKERNADAPQKTSFIPTRFSAEETDALLRVCKQNDSTVQAAVQTASQVAIAEMLHGGTVPEEYEFNVGVTVNLRNHFKERFADNMHHVAAYFAPWSMSTRVTADWENDFWQLAQATGKHLRLGIKAEIINTLKLFRVFNLFYKAKISIEYMLRKSYGRYETILVFTNLGNCNRLSNRKRMVKVVARYGSSGEHICGNIFANNLMTVAGQLFWTVTFSKHITSRETAQKYADTVRKVISFIIKEKS